MSSRSPVSGRRAPRVLMWGGIAVGVTALLVEVSRTGLDVLLLVVLLFAVVLLERTVGDWLGELLGTGWATVVLGTSISVTAWALLTEGGAADQFFAAAAQKGYRTLYYTGADSEAPPPARAPTAVGASTTVSRPAAAAQPARSGPAATSGSGAVEASREVESGQNGSQADVPLTGLFRGRAASALTIEVPTPIVTGETVTIRVRVTSDRQPLPGRSIAFTLNGRPIGTSRTERDGTGTLKFSLRVAGSYRVAAEFEGDEEVSGSTAGASVIVLPGRT